MRVLVAGAGIAGLTTAECLARAGHEVILAEGSPRVRESGPMIDFFGPGLIAAQRLDLMPAMEAAHREADSLVVHHPDGREKYKVPYPRLRNYLFEGRHFNFNGGGLEHVLYQKVADRVPIRFNATISGIDPFEESLLNISFADGTMETVDLLVGADGVHSPIRKQVFDNDDEYVRPMGYRTLSVTIENAELYEQLGSSVRIFAAVDRQVVVHRAEEGSVAAWLVHRASPHASGGDNHPSRELQTNYSGFAGPIADIVAGATQAGQVDFENVVQIVMPAWNRGRVVLVGDACSCSSVLSRQGDSLAMAAAYTLAGALTESPEDLPKALSSYERQWKPAVEQSQAAGRKMAKWMVPESRSALTFRDLAMRASTWRWARGFIRKRLALDGFISDRPVPASSTRAQLEPAQS